MFSWFSPKPTRRSNSKRPRQTRRKLATGFEALEWRRLLTVEIEPNNTLATATLFPAGNTLEGRVNGSADVDYFRTTLNQGAEFIIETANIRDPLFEPTFPPPLELVDSNGVIVASSSDGRDLKYVVPRTGDYFARISSASSFGTFTESYAMQTRVNAFAGNTEQEPNNSLPQATALNPGARFRGDLLASESVDLYSVNLNAGEVVVVDFTGPAPANPGVRLLNSSGAVLDSGLDGIGLATRVSQSGTYYLQVQANAAGQNVGQYVGVVNRYGHAATTAEIGDTLDNNVLFSFNALDFSQVIGTLDSIDDVDVFRLEVTNLARLDFSLQAPGYDPVSTQSKLISFYDQYGQLLNWSAGGNLAPDRSDAISPGTYYVTVSATSSSGLGAYGLHASALYWFANQRDVPLNFFDFTAQQATHVRYNWVNAFNQPQAIPYLLGSYESRMNAFDVNVTTTMPAAGPERISTGVGDFGVMDGSLGWGDGWYGQRRPSGDSASTVSGTFTSLSYDAWQLMNHEAGHASGLSHIRSPLSTMAYVESTEYFQIGDAYNFVGTDYRRPGSAKTNIRNYLDWALQAGSQVPELEPNNTPATTQLLNENLREMTADLRANPPLAAGAAPHQTLAADFNGDGFRDVIIAASDDNDVRLYLGNGSGGLTLRSTVRVNDLRWWEESLTIGDFNRDGRPDIALVSGSSNTIGVMLTNANGTLGTPNYFANVAEPLAIATADMNKDGRLDLIVGHIPGRISTYMGNGDGSFSAPQSVSTSLYPHSLAVADFNGDGWLDVACVNDPGNDMNVLHNDRSGRLTLVNTLPVGTVARAITTADFNGDGRPDLAAQARDNDFAMIYINSGNGLFSAGAATLGHRDAEYMTAGDINRDGIQDLVIGGFSTALIALLGDGTGKFGRPVTLEGGDSEFSVALADLTGDGFNDVITTAFFANTATVLVSLPNDIANDRVVITGQIDSATDVDRYSLVVKANDPYSFDIDAAEFQYLLDARLRIYDATGTLLASNDGAIDRESGLDSVDPYIVQSFSTAQTVVVEVSGTRGSAGKYRLKIRPQSTYSTDAPRFLATVPDNGTSRDTTNQVFFFLDSQLDPASLSNSSVTVAGQNTGVRTGTLAFLPLESAMVWTADSPLPVDSYTVTVPGNAALLRDFRGLAIDGNIASNFRFPTISGDGTPGGDYVTRFTITTADTTPATVTSKIYTRDPYQRGQFSLYFSDELQAQSATNAQYTLRGAGPDRVFATADDRLMVLDPIYDKIRNLQTSFIELFTRGVPDPDLYRVEATLRDAAGFVINLAETFSVGVTVPDTQLFTDAALTQMGLVGSYVNTSLRGATAAADWRSTQTISGTRVDPNLGFSVNNWGARASVGITGGSDANWDNYSVQWDGWIKITSAGTQLQLRSDDSSRMWVDLNNDGTFQSTELFNNNFGVGQSLTTGMLTPALGVGNYRIRVQYEEGLFDNRLYLEMITPDQPGQDDGFGHGPTVIGTNVVAGQTITTSLDKIEVTFSGALSLPTLTPQNFKLRFSPNPAFFDGNDSFVTDADGTIVWDAARRMATLQTANPLVDGYYMLELRGTTSGIAAPGGMLLDGEFMNSRIVGNTTARAWSDSPSGDGIAGGDYRSVFHVSISTLNLSIDPTSISEFGGQATATVTRVNPDDVGLAQTVLIASSDTSEAIAPASVVIPAGQLSATFIVQAIDDTLLDGTQSVNLNATAIGFVGAVATLQIRDHEPLQMNLSTTTISERGGTATGRLTRPAGTGALVVNLTSSLPGKATVPTTVSFAAGQLQSDEFTIAAIDNSLLDGAKQVTILASAPGYVDASRIVTVDDYEGLALAIAPSTISEDGGSATGTLTRTDPTGSLTVFLSVLSDVFIPTTVVIPAGQLSATFAISAIVDGLVDGTQLVTVRATASGYVEATAQIEVLDAEKLTLLPGAATISEVAFAIGRVRRTDVRGPLTVQLAASLPNQLTFPASITFLDGQAESASFRIDAIDNALVDGSRVVSLTASAPGYISAISNLEVTDSEQLSLELVGESQMPENNGLLRARVTRTDTRSALTVALRSSDTTEATVPATIEIPVGETTSAAFEIIAVNDMLLDGTQFVTINASAIGYLEGAFVPVAVLDSEKLKVEVAKSNLSEAGQSTTLTVSRQNTNIEQPLTVTLTSSAPSRLLVPFQLTIPAGQSSVNGSVLTVDDDLLNGMFSAVIQAQATGYLPDAVTISIEDHEKLLLEFAAANVPENAGTVTATIRRSNTDINQPITVQLTSDSSRFAPPASVTIPAGQASIGFSILVADDDLLTGSVVVNLEANSDGYITATTPITLTDFETLQVTFSQQEMSENGGSLIGTVTRSNSNRASELIVQLSSSDISGATVSAQVVIPANASSASFTITAVDDNLLDGTQLVNIVASATQYITGINTLRVNDFEQLVLTLAASSVAENGGLVSGAIRRPNTNTETAITVQLTTDQTSRLNVPNTVTIPAGQSQASFSIGIVDNAIKEGDLIATLSASSLGYVFAEQQLTIIDDESSFPWHNPRNGLDVNNDGFVTAIDALLVINQLNTGKGGRLDPPPPGNNVFYDTSSDNFVTAIDALLVINYINTHPGGEGEFTSLRRKGHRAFGLVLPKADKH